MQLFQGSSISFTRRFISLARSNFNCKLGKFFVVVSFTLYLTIFVHCFCGNFYRFSIIFLKLCPNSLTTHYFLFCNFSLDFYSQFSHLFMHFAVNFQLLHNLTYFYQLSLFVFFTTFFLKLYFLGKNHKLQLIDGSNFFLSTFAEFFHNFINNTLFRCFFHYFCCKFSTNSFT